jgi:hypothetical protein
MIIIFSGSIGRCGVGGLAWMNMQYLAGLQSMGHEVYYLEDCGLESWVYDWEGLKISQIPCPSSSNKYRRYIQYFSLYCARL